MSSGVFVCLFCVCGCFVFRKVFVYFVVMSYGLLMFSSFSYACACGCVLVVVFVCLCVL